MSKYIDTEKLRAEIERLKKDNEISEDKDYAQYELDVACGYDRALDDVLGILSTLEKSNSKDFPTTDEEINQFLATHPKVELPEKYKTPDWMFEKSEKPMNQDGLDEEIIKCWQEWVSPSNEQSVNGVLPLSEFAFYARHFAQWGAEHAEKGDTHVPKDLEEAAGKCIDDALFKWSYDDEDGIEQYVHDAFVAGAKWDREQMMNIKKKTNESNDKINRKGS